MRKNRPLLFFFAALLFPAMSMSADMELSAQREPIEFRTLLIIKKRTEAWSPFFLPIRSEMTEEEIRTARHCFEVETPDMIHTMTQGRVKFTPKVIVSETPLRLWNPDRKDSAEITGGEMLTEFRTLAKPGEYDSLGYYFLSRDYQTGYSAPRAGYGVGWYDSHFHLGMFAVSSTVMNPRDEIFLHEWLHGLERFYHDKEGVQLPRGWLHGGSNYSGYKEGVFRPQDTFRGWMSWYRDFLNAAIADEGSLRGLGEAAWRHGPIRETQPAVFPEVPRLPEPSYPPWLIGLMRGDLRDARLGEDMLSPLTDHPLDDWTLWSWAQGRSVEIRSAERGFVLTIHNEHPNHTTLSRKVQLRPYRNYLLTAEAKPERVEITEKGGVLGADLTVDGRSPHPPLPKDSDWQSVFIPFSTGGRENPVSLTFSLGGRGSLARGKVSFRNVRLREILYPESK